MKFPNMRGAYASLWNPARKLPVGHVNLSIQFIAWLRSPYATHNQ
jgi:hypothetical protein